MILHNCFTGRRTPPSETEKSSPPTNKPKPPPTTVTLGYPRKEEPRKADLSQLREDRGGAWSHTSQPLTSRRPPPCPLQRQNSLGPPPTKQTVHDTVAPADTRQEAKQPLTTGRPRPRSLKPSALEPSALRLSALLLFIELQRSASGVFDYGPCRGIAPGASSLRLLDAR